MYWTIDTGMIGMTGCPAEDLQKVLESARDHHAKTQPEHASAQVWLRASQSDRNEPARASGIAREADAAAQAVRDSLPEIHKQMNAGIKAACDLAADMGGQVTATVTGHIVKDHPHGLFRRISVHVDRAVSVES